MPNFALGIWKQSVWMIERDHIELMAHLERLEQKVQKDSLLIQFLVEQNKGLQEQLDKVTQLLISP